MSSESSTKIPTAANGWDDGTDNSARIFKQGKFIVELLPEGYVLLNKELMLGFHPKLSLILVNIPLNEIDERLAAVAVYVGIAVNDAYTIQERSKLAAMCAGRLQAMREIGH